MRRDDLFLSIVVAVCMALSIYTAHLEARTYTRITGKAAHAWDVLWQRLAIYGD